MHIKTERLLIRTYIESDFEEVFDIYKNEDTCRFLLHEPWTDEFAKQAFKLRLAQQKLEIDRILNLAVVYSGKVIGDLSLWHTNVRETIEIGYSFNQSASGQGFATEAVREVIKILFYELSIHRIQIQIDSRNINSKKLCERIGMRKEAHFVQNIWNKNEWTDSCVFAMLQSEHCQNNQ